MLGRQTSGTAEERARPATVLDSLWEPGTIARLLLAVESLAVILALAPGVEAGRWRYFLLASLTIQWVVLLTLGMLYLLRRELSRLKPVGIAYATLLMLVMSMLIVTGTAVVLNSDAWVLIRSDPVETLLRLVLICLTAGTVALLVFRNVWTARQMAVQAKQAQLDALRARVQPHFLFNTLNTAVALVAQRPDRAEQVLMDLADLFRAALASPRDITLAEELETTRRYLAIEAIRLGHRLRLTWNVPDPIPEAMVPSLAIQPLAENAILHGIETSSHGGEIVVEVKRAGECVLIRIENDVPASPAVHAGHHVGLASARERIAAAASGAGRLETHMLEGRHVATIELPLLAQATTR